MFVALLLMLTLYASAYCESYLQHKEVLHTGKMHYTTTTAINRTLVADFTTPVTKQCQVCTPYAIREKDFMTENHTKKHCSCEERALLETSKYIMKSAAHCGYTGGELVFIAECSLKDDGSIDLIEDAVTYNVNYDVLSNDLRKRALLEMCACFSKQRYEKVGPVDKPNVTLHLKMYGNGNEDEIAYSCKVRGAYSAAYTMTLVRSTDFGRFNHPLAKTIEEDFTYTQVVLGFVQYEPQRVFCMYHDNRSDWTVIAEYPERVTNLTYDVRRQLAEKLNIKLTPSQGAFLVYTVVPCALVGMICAFLGFCVMKLTCCADFILKKRPTKQDKKLLLKRKP